MSRKRKGFDLEPYRILATAEPGAETDLHHDGVLRYRTRTVEAGPMLYVSAHPVALRAPGEEARRRLQGVTREAQQRVNRKRSMLRVEQLIHANFTEGDTFATLTYRDEEEPATLDEVRRDLRNCLAKLRRRAKRLGTELKYLYVIELSERSDTDPRARENWHVHLVISGVSRDTVEDCWPHGYGNTRRLQDSQERFTGIAKYMLKRRASWRTWERSRNLTEPTERVTDRALSRRRVALVARDVRAAGKEIFERIYPGYQLIEDVDVRVSDFVPGAYIYARMRRRR